MLLQKTDRARAELKPEVPTPGRRERTLLLLAGGHKSIQDFKRPFDGDGEQIAIRLLRDGHLVTLATAKHTAIALPPATLTSGFVANGHSAEQLKNSPST